MNKVDRKRRIGKKKAPWKTPWVEGPAAALSKLAILHSPQHWVVKAKPG